MGEETNKRWRDERDVDARGTRVLHSGDVREALRIGPGAFAPDAPASASFETATLSIRDDKSTSVRAEGAA